LNNFIVVLHCFFDLGLYDNSLLGEGSIFILLLGGELGVSKVRIFANFSNLQFNFCGLLSDKVSIRSSSTDNDGSLESVDG